MVPPNAVTLSVHTLRRYVPDVSAVLLLWLLTVASFWKLLLPGQFTWCDSPDLVNQVLPWFQFQAHAIQTGTLPLWDPYHWGGQALVGQMQPGFSYPFNWLLFLAPMQNGHLSLAILNAYFIAIHCMAATSAYLLCRGLACSRRAAVIAGLGFGVGGFVGMTDWPQMINGAVWIPLALLAYLRATRSGRFACWAVLAGGATGMAWLSGHHQVPILLCFALVVCAAIELYGEALPPSRAAGVLAVLFATAALVGAAQLLPAYSYWHDALRWVGSAHPVSLGEAVPYSVHARASMNPISVLGIVIPGIFTNGNPFSGFVLVSLAAIAVSCRWNERLVKLFAALGVFFLVFSLGANSPLHGVLYTVLPLLDKARSPHMASGFFHLGVVALAAYGFDALRLSSAPARLAARALGLCSLAIWLVLLMLTLLDIGKTMQYTWIGTAALVSGMLAGTMQWWHMGRIQARGLTVSLVALLLLELGSVTGYNYANKDSGWKLLDTLKSHDDIAAALRKEPEPVRIGVDGAAIPYNFGDWYGIEQSGGYCGVTKNVYRAGGTAGGRALLGENRWIGTAPPRAGLSVWYVSPSGLRIYADATAFPRVWTVHDVKSLPSAVAIAPALEQPLDTLRSQAFVVGPAPAVEACSGDRVNILHHGLNSVAVESSMTCRGMLVLGDTYDPDWQVRVDGQRQPLWLAYSFLRGVVVPAGRHRVEFDYRPMSVYAGLAGTGLGLLAVMLAGLRLARRST
jgi:hypothetical protein